MQLSKNCIFSGSWSKSQKRRIYRSLTKCFPLRGKGGGVPWVHIMENELECLGDRRGHDGH